ncbi:hypothetical protein Mal4_25890 [Maioricimonas rarisocia]|uniref:SxtJ n=1 Tax=Maioricimonas rarisocia TaxID=2528026 RepID=A0A517Z6Z3_9PLAN|nr:SxtJ family membrane protein [Maioricimonas rarisocia]QDU38262.1 hypothetical protein Mal4_25890 [Maioricimonas rarisocia]
MALVEINRNPSTKDLRVFAVLQIIFFSVVAWIVYSRTGSTTAAVLIVTISAAVGLFGLVVPSRLRLVYVGWMMAVFPIGWLISHAVLVITYYLVLTPIGLILRMRGYDPLGQKFDPDTATYWNDRPPARDAKDYYRQF